MYPDFPLNPLIFIIGPTGVGKSRFAIELAKIIDGEIISADSRSFYRGMDIGTAKPSAEDMESVPHHLVDIANPDETISLNLFIRLVMKCVEEIHSRNKVPLLVGGTGQYVRAILEGWQIPEGEPNQRLRTILEKIGLEKGATKLHHHLSILDKDAADAIDQANMRRTVRALEVILTSGRTYSSQRNRAGCQFSTLILGLMMPRNELYARVDNRIDQMIKDGLETETINLLKQGFSASFPAMSAIGYKEMTMAINGEISREEAVMLMKRRTRVFIRRQSAWFHSDDPDIHWFNPNAEFLDHALQTLRVPKNWKVSP